MIENYIVGAGGFLGTRLMSKLVRSDTVLLDWQHLFNLTDLQPHRRFFYLATYGNMAQHDQGSPEILTANVVKPAHILGILLRKKIPCESFVYVSTSSVTLPIQTTYSGTKRAAEEMLLAHRDIPACIVRPYSITGVGEQKEHLIPKLIDSCMAGTRMDFVGEPTHDFIDVEDAVSAILLLSERKRLGVFEIGTSFLNSNYDILELVENACGKAANLHNIKTMRTYDSGYWCCDNTRAIEEGWAPMKRVKQSIEEMVEAYKHEHA